MCSLGHPEEARLPPASQSKSRGGSRHCSQPICTFPLRAAVWPGPCADRMRSWNRLSRGFANSFRPGASRVARRRPPERRNRCSGNHAGGAELRALCCARSRTIVSASTKVHARSAGRYCQRDGVRQPTQVATAANVMGTAEPDRREWLSDAFRLLNFLNVRSPRHRASYQGGARGFGRRRASAAHTAESSAPARMRNPHAERPATCNECPKTFWDCCARSWSNSRK